MSLNSKRICKLCLEARSEIISILSEEGLRLNIDSTLQQHFCFKFETGTSNNICRKCWLHVEAFHEFYLRIEEIHRNPARGDRIFTATLDDEVYYGVKQAKETVEKPQAKSRTSRSLRSRTRADVDVSIPFVVETRTNDYYWEDVNAIVNENIGAAFIPKQEIIENTEEEEQTGTNSFCENIIEDDDDMPLSMFKGKTDQDSAECVPQKRELVDNEPFECELEGYSQPSEIIKNQNTDTPPSTLAPSVSAKPKSNDKKSSGKKPAKTSTKKKEKKTSKKRPRPERNLKNAPITPEMMKQLEALVRFEEKFECENIDYNSIKKYIDLVCDLCKEPFSTFAESQKHFLNIHQRPAYWKCCRVQLDAEYQVVDHMRYHQDEDVFRCIACQRQFLTTTKLRHHIRRTHLANTDAELECWICSKKFSSQRHFILHEKRHITFECPHCSKVITAANFERHIRFAHTESEKVMCDICGKVSCDRKAHSLHYLVEHSGIDQKLQCDICGQWAKHRKQLSKHMRKHFDTPQTCKICGKITPNKYALSSHITLHKEGKHKCRFCGKVFLKRKLLQEHKKYLYQCDSCFNSGIYANRKKVHPREYLNKFKNPIGNI